MLGKYWIKQFNFIISLVIILFLRSCPLNAQTTVVSGLNNPFEVTIQGNTAYVGEFSGSSISSIDLTATNPLTETALSNFSQPTIIVFNNNDVYLGQANGVITKRSATDFSANLETIFVNTSPVVGIAINGNDLYFSEFVDNGRIQRIDLTNIAAGSETIATGFSFAEQIALIGNDLFVASRMSGLLEKIDISITNPNIETVISGLNNPSGLHLIGTMLYITESQTNGRILSIDTTESTPAVNTIVSGVDIPFGIDSLNGSLYVVLRGNDSLVRFDNVLSTDEFSIESDILLFPNPIKNGQVTLQGFKEEADINVSIYNMLGQEIFSFSEPITPPSLTVKVPNINTGTYIIIVKNNQIKTQQKLVVK